MKNNQIGHELWFLNEHGKNNELRRTETNSDSVSSYGVSPSSLLIFYLRFVLVYILRPSFSMKPAPASDSAVFLTQLNDIFFKINCGGRCEN